MDPYSPLKRVGYLEWDDYFMAVAFLSAKRSKDPNRQVCLRPEELRVALLPLSNHVNHAWMVQFNHSEELFVA